MDLDVRDIGQTHQDRPDLTGTVHLDALSRSVYGVLGIPVDAVDISTVVDRLCAAMRQDAPFLLSTPNLNFLVSSQTDPEFRESLLQSDLCPVDGVPIVWIARLLGIPIKMRVAGSDIFDRLKQERSRSVKVFLFGGPEGVAETCGHVLNAQNSGVVCSGTLFPGFGTIEDMSTQPILEVINASEARFVVASLGAQKGQGWLLRNHHRLRIPVRSHLGAAINFQGGLLKRAPLFVRRSGFEWLWRIKEEPHLWRRYFQDGMVLLRLILTSVLPLAIGGLWRGIFVADERALEISVDECQPKTVKLGGCAVERHVATAIPVFRHAIDRSHQLTVDVSSLTTIDQRFLGLLLMVRKQMVGRGGHLQIAGARSHLRRAFRLNGFEFLLNSNAAVERPSLAPDRVFARPEVAIGAALREEGFNRSATT